jgi:hypothetical protein
MQLLITNDGENKIIILCIHFDIFIPKSFEFTIKGRKSLFLNIQIGEKEKSYF